MGKIVGIVGYGNMGSAFARRLIGFGVHVVAYDKYKTGFGDGFVHEVTMEELMQVSDIVSLHVPLTKETHYLADTGWFGRFSKNFYLINTSRGQVVKTADLLEAIRSGHVLGAALDVLEFENYTFEQLKESIHSSVFQEVAASEKIILSPHIAGFSTESPYKMAKVLLEKIKSQLGL
jgi:D-3-phosphoglycerate dehydrogenase